MEASQGAPDGNGPTAPLLRLRALRALGVRHPPAPGSQPQPLAFYSASPWPCRPLRKPLARPRPSRAPHPAGLGALAFSPRVHGTWAAASHFQPPYTDLFQIELGEATPLSFPTLPPPSPLKILQKQPSLRSTDYSAWESCHLGNR